MNWQNRLGLVACMVYGLGSNLAAAQGQPQPDAYAAYKPHMQLVYRSLTAILNDTLQGSDNKKQPEREALNNFYQVLSDEAAAIEALAVKTDADHAFEAKELAEAARAASLQYKAAHFKEAKFFMTDVVSSCFNCHLSRTSSQDSKFTQDFDQKLDLQRLEPLAQARFLALSRRFDQALDRYESWLVSPDADNERLLEMDPMLEYLVIALRVRNEPERTIKTFERFQKLPHPALIKNEVAGWLKTLKDLPAQGSLDDMAFARKLLTAKSAAANARPPLIEAILASKRLVAVIDDKKRPVADRTEAYLLLGRCGLATDNQVFPEHSREDFAAAIRLQPKGPLAREAYRLYEESTLFLFSGSSGTHLPDEEKQKLKELKQLAY